MEKRPRMTVDEFFNFFSISPEYVYFIFFTSNFKKDLKKCY